MNSRIFFGVTCWLALVTFDSVTAQEKYPGGIVYGPKAAFNIAAPEGWVLDNESGAQQGLPCVLPGQSVRGPVRPAAGPPIPDRSTRG